jgi:hypothetical protein
MIRIHRKGERARPRINAPKGHPTSTTHSTPAICQIAGVSIWSCAPKSFFRYQRRRLAPVTSATDGSLLRSLYKIYLRIPGTVLETVAARVETSPQSAVSMFANVRYRMKGISSVTASLVKQIYKESGLIVSVRSSPLASRRT